MLKTGLSLGRSPASKPNLLRLPGSVLTFWVGKNPPYAMLQNGCLGQHRGSPRDQDAAYFLLGIFEVTMPPIYGEGRKAFMRLQEETLKANEHQSILAWGIYDQVAKETKHTRLTVHEGSTIFAGSASQFQVPRNSVLSPNYSDLELNRSLVGHQVQAIHHQ